MIIYVYYLVTTALLTNFYHCFVPFLPIQAQHPTIGSKCSNRMGYNNRDTVRIQGGYSQDTGEETGRIQSG